MASNEYGDPVQAQNASRVIEELHTHGYVDVRQGKCRPVLPSLTSHFNEMRRASSMQDNEVLQAIRAALPDRTVQEG